MYYNLTKSSIYVGQEKKSLSMGIFRINGEVLINLRSRISGSNNHSLASTTSLQTIIGHYGGGGEGSGGRGRGGD